MENLFEQWAGEPCCKRSQITANGSNRLYYRLEGESRVCIGTYNGDVRENESFFYYSEQLKRRGFRVPEVYSISADRKTYLQEDLGNVTLYSYLNSRRSNGVNIQVPMKELYQRAIEQLIKMQIDCRDVDFSKSYPRSSFDSQSIQWDLNYFKYYFLRLFHIPHDEQLLERDFQVFIRYLLEDETNYFMFRDFQSRNIMLHEDELYFIDYQGARQGARQYDLASLLYSAKSEVPETLRKELLEYYMDCAEEYESKRGGKFDRGLFRARYYGYVLVRMMQAMGSYGFRGVIEKKDYFVKSIPLAVNNLKNVLQQIELQIEIPQLREVWEEIIHMEEFSTEKEQLTVSIFSFSYKRGIPFDKSGNGGGYVFDCRSLPNPGREEYYRQMTGRDEAVIQFFKAHDEEVESYLTSVRQLVGQSIKNYQERGFTRLMINFGCTGGRHRSVYCAEQIAQFVRQNFDCNVSLHHLEQSKV